MDTIIDPKNKNLTGVDATKQTIKKFKPNLRLMDKQDIYSLWLESEHPKYKTYTNKQYYESKDLDPAEAFNADFPTEGLYKVQGRNIQGHIGDYELDTAKGRLNFVLDNIDKTEREDMENKTRLRALAWAADWYDQNPQITGVDSESEGEWIKRMKTAYKKRFKKNYPI